MSSMCTCVTEASLFHKNKIYLTTYIFGGFLFFHHAPIPDYSDTLLIIYGKNSNSPIIPPPPNYSIFESRLHKKMKFSIKGFFSKCDQIRRKLRIWSHLLKKSLMENFIFRAEVDESHTQWLSGFNEFL